MIKRREVSVNSNKPVLIHSHTVCR